MNAFRLLTWFMLIGLSSTTQAGGRSENRFGSIFIDGKKAGQIHYTVEYGEGGDVETLHTRASLSILGLKVFNFEQNLNEKWRRGELHQLRGRTDDDGKIYDAALDRGPELYKGTLNGSRWSRGLPEGLRMAKIARAIGVGRGRKRNTLRY